MKIFTENTEAEKLQEMLELLNQFKQPKENLKTIHWFKPNSTSDRKYYYSKADTKLDPGELVVMYLTDLEPCSIRLLNDILYSNKDYKKIIKRKDKPDKVFYNTQHHQVIVFYNKTKYIFDSLEELKHSYTSKEDVNRIHTEKHQLLKEYELRQQHRKEYKENKKSKDTYNVFIQYLGEQPNEHDMDIMLDTFGKLYHIYNSSDPITKIQNYIQVKWYVEHDIEPDYIPDEDVELSIGNAAMLDDFIYKFRLQTEN